MPDHGQDRPSTLRRRAPSGLGRGHRPGAQRSRVARIAAPAAPVWGVLEALNQQQLFITSPSCSRSSASPDREHGDPRRRQGRTSLHIVLNSRARTYQDTTITARARCGAASASFAALIDGAPRSAAIHRRRGARRRAKALTQYRPTTAPRSRPQHQAIAPTSTASSASSATRRGQAVPMTSGRRDAARQSSAWDDRHCRRRTRLGNNQAELGIHRLPSPRRGQRDDRRSPAPSDSHLEVCSERLQRSHLNYPAGTRSACRCTWTARPGACCNRMLRGAQDVEPSHG